MELPQMKTYSDVRSSYINSMLKPLVTASHGFLSTLVSNEIDSTIGMLDSSLIKILDSNNIIQMGSLLSSQAHIVAAVSAAASYTRKTCPFLPYIGLLLRLLKAEKDIIQKILPKKLGLPIQTFQATTGPSIDTLIDSLDLLLTKIRRIIGTKKETVFMSGSVSDSAFVLLDVLECFSGHFKEHDGVITVRSYLSITNC